MILRIREFFEYLFNVDVIKEQREEDIQFEEALTRIAQLEQELKIVKNSRDRYLKNCKKLREQLKVSKKGLNDGKRSL